MEITYKSKKIQKLCKDIKATVQYGKNLQALVVALNTVGAFRNFMESRCMTAGAPIGSTQTAFTLSVASIYCVN